MSIQAINWVIEDAPDLPPHLFAVLLGLANHADHNGRGSYVGQKTLAWYTRKGHRAVRSDVDALEELGLIRRGDQRRVLHLPPDERPVVWDLAMDRCRDPRPGRGRDGRPTKQQLSDPAETGGAHTSPPFTDPETEGIPTPPRLETEGVPTTNRGGLQNQTEGVCTPPEPSFEPSKNQPPLPPASGGSPSPAGQPPTPDPVPGQRRPCGRAHPDTAACRACRTNPRSVALAHTRPARPTWCGQCNPDTRLVETATPVRRCPTCHPANRRPADVEANS